MKRLRDIVEKYPDNYQQKTPIAQSFVAMHKDEKIIDNLGEKGSTEAQFKGGTKEAPYNKQSKDMGFPSEDEPNQFNLPTYYDKSDAGGNDEYDDDDFEYDDNDVDNDETRSRIVHDEETELDENKGPDYGPAMGEEIGRLTFPQLMEKWKQIDEAMEESEQLDEISARKLRAYAKGARRDIEVTAEPLYTDKDASPGTEKEKRIFNRMIKRDKGIDLANAKLRTKRNEETERLDEMMTRKHFREVANTVRAIEDPKKRAEYAQHHAAIFAKSNPRFNAAKFYEAAGTPMQLTTKRVK